MAQAKRYSRELRQAANTYCEDAMRRTEEAVGEAFDEIKKARSRFRAAAASAEGVPQGGQGEQPQREIFDAEAEE